MPRQEPGEVRYSYLRDATSTPVAIIATRLREAAPGLVMDFGLSVMNPKDKSFNPDFGKEIALRRLEKQRRQLIGSVLVQPRTKAAIMQLLADGNHPKQVKKAAKHWLETHPERTDETVA